MKTQTWSRAMACLVTLMMLLGASTASATVDVGDRPTLSLEDLQGESVDIEAFRGQVVRSVQRNWL